MVTGYGRIVERNNVFGCSANDDFVAVNFDLPALQIPGHYLEKSH
jgi:hypothetical protein